MIQLCVVRAEGARGVIPHRGQVRSRIHEQPLALFVGEELVDGSNARLVGSQRVTLLGLAFEGGHDARDEPVLEDLHGIPLVASSSFVPHGARTVSRVYMCVCSLSSINYLVDFLF